MDYQVEEMAKALHFVTCSGDHHSNPDDGDVADAKELVEYLFEQGYRLSRLDPEPAIEGPLQRALGLGDSSDSRS